MSDVKGVSWPAPGKTDEGFKSVLEDFSLSLFRESALNKGNVMISPVSVFLALGMALNGADGETRRGMLDALKAKGMDEEALNAACRNLVAQEAVKAGKTELSIANSIWYREGFVPDKDFLKKNADYFSAAVQARDFSKPETVSAINGWVDQSTKGTIQKIIDKIDPDVIMYLMNAVYFKADWKRPFDANDTVDSPFKTPGGDVQAKFMHSEKSADYIDYNGLKGIVLPYDDGKFSFFALLPKEGQDIRDFVNSLDADTVKALESSVKSGVVKLALPKFKTRYEDSLKDELSKLGMGTAFDASKADFSLMNQERKKDLFISEIRHKTFCNVDELGTEAAAVTSIEMKLTAMPPDAGVEISFDRPFVYGIVDTVSSAPLFLGIMEDPTKQ